MHILYVELLSDNLQFSGTGPKTCILLVGNIVISITLYFQMSFLVIIIIKLFHHRTFKVFDVVHYMNDVISR